MLHDAKGVSEKSSIFVAMIKIYYLLMGCLLLVGCSQKPHDITMVSQLPAIYPDYVGVTVPANIAPLNFCMEDEGYTAMSVQIKGSRKGAMETSGEDAEFDIEQWHQLLRDNRGGKLTLTVVAKKDGQWRQFKPFDIFVDKQRMKEWGVTYRMVAPGYELYGMQGLFQRCLSNFDEFAIYRTTEVPGSCVNCHTANATNPDEFTLHIRGEKGATLIRHQGKDDWMKSKNLEVGGPMVFPCWHPSGKFIAFSTNDTHQGFHSSDKNRIEVYDQKSDVVVYDLESGSIFTSPLLSSQRSWETYPCFSPDGRKLYFSTADSVAMPARYKEVKYSICSIDFDAAHHRFATQVDTLFSAHLSGKSAVMPRISPDGKWLAMTVADYGCFPIWHHEADLYIINLRTRQYHPLAAANSRDTESYHSWSSNGRWLLYASRRVNGLYSMPYIVHIDAQG